MSSKKICSHPTSGYLCGCVCSVMSDSLGPHGLQHTRLPCLSLSPWAYSNSCSSSPWCHPTISSSVTLFSSRLQSFPASGSFPMSHSFASGGRSTGASASAPVLPMNLHDGSPLGWTGLSPCCPRDIHTKGMKIATTLMAGVKITGCGVIDHINTVMLNFVNWK